MGFLLGFMAWRTDSIIPVIIVHFINNSMGLLVVNFWYENYEPIPTKIEWWEWAMFAVGIPILIYSAKYFIRITKPPVHSQGAIYCYTK